MSIHRSWLLSLFFPFCINSIFAQGSAEVSTDRRFYLSGRDAETNVHWDFQVSSGRKNGSWSKILVPSNWELQGFGSFHPPSGKTENLSNDEREIGIYRHQFPANPDWKRSDVHLVFEGVLSDFEVVINGENLIHDYSKALGRTVFDISEFIDFKNENILEVKVYKYTKNEIVKSLNTSKNHWTFGGIYRPVYLEILPRHHFSISRLEASADGRLRAQLDFSDPPGSAEILVELQERSSGKTLAEFSQEVQEDLAIVDHVFEGIESWNPEDPKLYQVTFSLVQGNKKRYLKRKIIGFRTAQWSEENELYINRIPVKLRVVERVPFYPASGRSLSEENMLEEIHLIKAMNGNAVLMPLIGPEERFLELADSLGLLVIVSDGPESEYFHPSAIDLGDGAILSPGMENAGAISVEAVIRDDLGGILDFDRAVAADRILDPYRRKNGKFYSIREFWSPVQVLDFDPNHDFSGRILLENHSNFSNLGAFRIRWSVEKLNAWDAPETLHRGSIALPKVLPGDSVQIDLNLPTGWRDGDLLKLTVIDTDGNELNTWSKSIRTAQAGNAAYFGSLPVLEEKGVLVRESSTDLQFAVGNRLFVFGKETGDLKMVKVNREPIYLTQVKEHDHSLSSQRKVTWKQSNDGAVKISSVSDLGSEYFSWTVFPSGELLLKAGLPQAVDIDFSGIGFVLKESDYEQINWIGNGPFPVAELTQTNSKFGLWEQTNSLETKTPTSSYRPDNISGFYTDIHAFRLVGDREQVEIRMESTDLALRINHLRIEENEFPSESSLSENVELWIGPIPDIKNLNSKSILNAQPGNSRIDEIVLWFRFD